MRLWRRSRWRGGSKAIQGYHHVMKETLTTRSWYAESSKREAIAASEVMPMSVGGIMESSHGRGQVKVEVASNSPFPPPPPTPYQGPQDLSPYWPRQHDHITSRKVGLGSCERVCPDSILPYEPLQMCTHSPSAVHLCSPYVIIVFGDDDTSLQFPHLPADCVRGQSATLFSCMVYVPLSKSDKSPSRRTKRKPPKKIGKYVETSRIIKATSVCVCSL